ncbi:hypothetical protein UPYG_G00060000 [Umbra pygmaea]|uniref:Transmembrane channel-like protein n=1 Tax=Umbra pygmaea TaxID=75934 RepID=A0ABD0X955_UMBPY
MARNVNFDLNPHHLEACLESPVDEEGVHDSFTQLIEEQEEESQEALELEELQRELNLEEDQPEPVEYLSGPSDEVWNQRPEEGRSLLDPTEERWCSATLRVLSSMPSRTIGRNRGAIISQYYNRTMQLRRRRQSRPALGAFSRSARPSICGYGIEVDGNDADERKREDLVNNLQSLSVSDRVRMLRAMPLCVAEKQKLRQLVTQKSLRSKHSQIPCCSRLKYCIINALRQSWFAWLSFLNSLQLWQVALKKAIHPPKLTQGRTTFSGLELLTGGGYFTNSVMYYGYYGNYTVYKNCSISGSSSASSDNLTPSHSLSSQSVAPHCHAEVKLSYNMPLAYFFTIGMAFFLTGIVLVYSMSKSFGRSFRIDKSHGVLAMKVFCSWDFKVIKRSSVKLCSENISTQLKELLAEVNLMSSQKPLCLKLGRVLVHGLAWVICVGSTLASVLAVHFLSEHMYNGMEVQTKSTHSTNRSAPATSVEEASLLALPVVVSLFNLLLPGLFNAAAWMERMSLPNLLLLCQPLHTYISVSQLEIHTYISVSRNLLLKMSLLAVLCYRWLGRIAVGREDIGLPCWETFVGQELYRFLLMDFIFTLLYTFFGEFLWRLFSLKVLKRTRKPVFDIARNVLELIYGQTLAWLGVLFTPLLPVVQIIKLLLLFYIKLASVRMNCQSPRKPYRASQMTTIFITLLCFPSFLGAAVCVTYSMWSLRPSLSCGPFRSLAYMCQSGKLWVADLAEHNPNLAWLPWAHSYLVENPMFLFLAAVIFLIVIYFHSQVVDGQRKIVSLLQEQIENEGEDKKFLITRLQAIHEQKRPAQRRKLPRQVSMESNC